MPLQGRRPGGLGWHHGETQTGRSLVEIKQTSWRRPRERREHRVLPAPPCGPEEASIARP